MMGEGGTLLLGSVSNKTWWDGWWAGSFHDHIEKSSLNTKDQEVAWIGSEYVSTYLPTYLPFPFLQYTTDITLRYTTTYMYVVYTMDGTACMTTFFCMSHAP